MAPRRTPMRTVRNAAAWLGSIRKLRSSRPLRARGPKYGQSSVSSAQAAAILRDIRVRIQLAKQSGDRFRLHRRTGKKSLILIATETPQAFQLRGRFHVSGRATHLDDLGFRGFPSAPDWREDGFEPVNFIGRFCSDRTNLWASRSNALSSPRLIFDNLTSTVGCGT